jgi:bacterioferritin-associated ferredoxin
VIVCHCNAVSDREVTAAAAAGARDVADVAGACGAGSDCRGCHERIKALLDRMESPLLLQEAS